MSTVYLDKQTDGKRRLVQHENACHRYFKIDRNLCWRKTKFEEYLGILVWTIGFTNRTLLTCIMYFDPLYSQCAISLPSENIFLGARERRIGKN